MWKKLPCARSELELLFTLCGGQCFRWKKTDSGEWSGVFANRVWTLSQNDEYLLYKVTKSSELESSKRGSETSKENNVGNKPNKSLRGKSKKNPKSVSEAEDSSGQKNGDADSLECELLRKYFQLDVILADHYADWSKKDPHFKKSAEKFTGVRILAQDPVENVFSFICSSNNNIARISSMVEKLCSLYGNKIADVDGVAYHDFPTIAALMDSSVEKALRDAGFGYRAKFINRSACKIMEMGGLSWLEHLKTVPYEMAKIELMKLPGIGAKVADCICLMSLGHLEAIPVDTHIYQVAVQRYLPHLKGRKTVTDKIYDEIGDHFRVLFGTLAGWAHTILFCADLKMFQDSPTKRNAQEEVKTVKKKGKR